MKFWVISVVRGVQTRTKRASAPVRHRFKQDLLDGRIRLIRKRPQPLQEKFLQDYYDDLFDLQEQGILEVREVTVDGRVHSFIPEAVAWKRACKEARKEHARKQAAMRREGKVAAANALKLVLPEASRFGTEEARPEPESEEIEIEDLDEDEVEELEDIDFAEDDENSGVEELSKPVDRMNKTELQEHLTRLGGDPGEMTKAQLRSAIEDTPRGRK